MSIPGWLAGIAQVVLAIAFVLFVATGVTATVYRRFGRWLVGRLVAGLWMHATERTNRAVRIRDAYDKLNSAVWTITIWGTYPSSKDHQDKRVEAMEALGAVQLDCPELKATLDTIGAGCMPGLRLDPDEAQALLEDVRVGIRRRLQ